MALLDWVWVRMSTVFVSLAGLMHAGCVDVNRRAQVGAHTMSLHLGLRLQAIMPAQSALSRVHQ